MAAEADFLARLARQLGGPERRAEPVWPPEPLEIPAAPDDPHALADRFTAELERVGGRVHRVADAAAVGPCLAALLSGGGLVVRTLEGYDVDAALVATGCRVLSGFTEPAAFREAARQAVAGLTGCDHAIAETGTLVLGSHHTRLASLLPPVHLAVVRLDQLVLSAATVFEHLARQEPASQVVFITGPSRSADIESDLSIGVHGPKEVHVVLVG